VAESRERVRSALNALGLALPSRHITVNLAPADVLKEGSHFDLPIALALLAAMEVLPEIELGGYTALGEVALDGSLTSVAGVLLAALAAASRQSGLICPAECGSEAAWAGEVEIIAAPSLLAIVNHFKGTQLLPPPEPQLAQPRAASLDFKDVKGQESAKRALEIAAAGGHNLLMIGPPGTGKSMLAARLPGILPPLEPAEALELGMIQSVAGGLRNGGLLRERPFRDPHHSASLPALVGGGLRTRPGEISLAHQGVLFLDELPEFNRAALEALRQPLETGRVSVARANSHVTFPARVQLVAAMNPCRCGYLAEPGRACGRAPRCAQEYQARISGPLLDRIDLHIDVPRSRRPIWPCRRLRNRAPRSRTALRPPELGKGCATRNSRWTAVSGRMPRRMANSSMRSPRLTRPAARCYSAPPSGCGCRHGAITACCGWRAPWQISKAPRPSRATTSRRRSLIADPSICMRASAADPRRGLTLQAAALESGLRTFSKLLLRTTWRRLRRSPFAPSIIAGWRRPNGDFAWILVRNW